MAQYTVQGRIKLLYNYDKLSESKSSVQYKLSSNGVVLRFGEICSISLFHTNTRDTRRLGYSRVRVFDSGRKSGPSVTEEGSLSDSDLEEFEEREDDLTSFRGLVLDISCRPVNVVCWKRAICMEFMEKADVLEYYDQTVNSPSGSFYIPAVLRVRQLLQVVKRKRIRNTLSRKNIFYRDGFTCQYCYATANLTIDHVTPIARGGKWEWENLVTACAKCNSRKGQKTPEEANMELIKVPKVRSPSTNRIGTVQHPPHHGQVHQERYSSHSLGVPFLTLSFLKAALVKGIASMSYSFGACKPRIGVPKGKAGNVKSVFTKVLFDLCN